MEPTPYEEDEGNVEPVHCIVPNDHYLPARCYMHRQEKRKLARQYLNKEKKAFAQTRRNAIVYMNKTQREMKKTYNTIVEQQKEEHRQQRDEHRARHQNPGARMDDTGSVPVVVSQSGY